MIISKKLTKLLLGLTFAGIIGISSGDIIGQTLLHQDTTVHAASHRQKVIIAMSVGSTPLLALGRLIREKGLYANIYWLWSSGQYSRLCRW